MLAETPIHLLLAQMMVERGMLDSIAAGFRDARYRFEAYIGQGNTVYVLAAVAVLAYLLLFRRRR